MAWFNDGNWTGLRVDAIPTLMLEVCKAIDERFHALFDPASATEPRFYTPSGRKASSAVSLGDMESLSNTECGYFMGDCLACLRSGLTPRSGSSANPVITTGADVYDGLKPLNERRWVNRDDFDEISNSITGLAAWAGLPSIVPNRGQTASFGGSGDVVHVVRTDPSVWNWFKGILDEMVVLRHVVAVAFNPGRSDIGQRFRYIGDDVENAGTNANLEEAWDDMRAAAPVIENGLGTTAEQRLFLHSPYVPPSPLKNLASATHDASVEWFMHTDLMPASGGEVTAEWDIVRPNFGPGVDSSQWDAEWDLEVNGVAVATLDTGALPVTPSGAWSILRGAKTAARFTQPVASLPSTVPYTIPLPGGFSPIYAVGVAPSELRVWIDYRNEFTYVS